MVVSPMVFSVLVLSSGTALQQPFQIAVQSAAASPLPASVAIMASAPDSDSPAKPSSPIEQMGDASSVQVANRAPAPSAAAPAPHRLRTPSPDPSAPSPDVNQTFAPFDEPTIALLQVGSSIGVLAGVAVLALFTINSSPVGVAFFSVAAVLTPAAVGYIDAWLGDRFGARRGAAGETIAAAYLALLPLAAVALAALTVGVSQQTGNGFIIAALGAAAVSAVAVPVLPAATYWWRSEPKRLGDEGTAAPGICAPNHPPRRRHSVAEAMAY